jgi:hypothetical protein
LVQGVSSWPWAAQFRPPYLPPTSAGLELRPRHLDPLLPAATTVCCSRTLHIVAAPTPPQTSAHSAASIWGWCTHAARPCALTCRYSTPPTAQLPGSTYTCCPAVCVWYICTRDDDGVVWTYMPPQQQLLAPNVVGVPVMLQGTQPKALRKQPPEHHHSNSLFMVIRCIAHVATQRPMTTVY